MAKWTKNKVTPEQINNGNEYTVNDNVSLEALNGIVNNSFKAQEDAERALELAEGANKANGTVVEINGEPQGTWDATFSQKLYEESKNEFNINSKEIVWGQYWVNGTNAGGFANSFYSIQEIKPNTTYAISFKNEINPSRYAYNILDANKNPISWKYDSTARVTKNWIFTTESNARYIVISQLDTSIENIGDLSIQLEKGSVATEFHPYNPNRHITNNEAEFLKEEHDKQKNIFDINQSWESGGSYGYVQDNKLYVESIGGNGGYVIGEEKYHVNVGEKYAVSGTYQMTTGRAVVRAYNSSGSELSTGISGLNSYNASYKGFWGDFPCVLEITSSDVAYIRIGFVALDTSDTTVGQYYYYENIQLEKNDSVTSYEPYNSASHITNPQADLLKSEWEKQVNLLNVQDKNLTTLNGITYSIKDGVITINGTATETSYINLPKLTLQPGTYYLNGLTQNLEGGVRMYLNLIETIVLIENTKGGKASITSERTANEFYIRISSGYTCNNVIIKPMLSKGDKNLPYQPYNPNRHITNGEAEFLKEEWEKSLNLFDNNGNISLMNIGLVEGEQYTIRVFNSTTPYYYKIAPTATSGNNETLKTGIFNSNKSFTFTFNAERNWSLFLYNSSWGGLTLTDYDIMLVKGTTAPDTFQQYNGQIIRKKDITPVLLWKFGQIDVTQERQADLTMLSREGYKYIIVAYQEYKGWEYVRRYAKFKMISSTRNVIVINDSHSPSTMSSRRIIIGDNTTLTINEGYVDGTQNNNVIIIQEVYGSNY